jgi:hypothetical protein
VHYHTLTAYTIMHYHKLSYTVLIYCAHTLCSSYTVLTHCARHTLCSHTVLVIHCAHTLCSSYTVLTLSYLRRLSNRITSVATKYRLDNALTGRAMLPPDQVLIDCTINRLYY